MAKVLELKEHRRQLAAKRGFESWTRRFSEPFDVNTTAGDISAETLCMLIESGEDPSMAFYELIMGFLGMGKGPRFYSLEPADIITVTDITLFLTDQLRFEAMRRLGWIEDWPRADIPLLDLVEQFSSRFAAVKHDTPSLSEKHPRFSEYQATFEGDRNAFVRRLIPDVIEEFRERHMPH